MRLKGATELNIETHVLKGNLGKVRSRLQGIDLESGITVLALQPEIGKTHTFIEYCKEHPNKKIGYFAPDHELLKEVESKLRSKGISNVIRWEGQKLKCKLYDDKYVSIWTNLNLSISAFCSSCEYHLNCNYKKQFVHQDKGITLAPSAYLGTNYISEKFDIIFIDEFLKDCKEYSLALTKDDVKQAKSYRDIDSIEDSDILYKVADGSDDFNINKIRGLYESLEDVCMKSLPNRDQFIIFTNLLSNLKKSIEFFEWRRMYADCKLYTSELDKYYEPHVYNLFRQAELIPVILLDATFNQELFEDLLAGYDGEFGIKNTFDITIYYSELFNIKSNVVKVNPKSWYPRSSISYDQINKVKYMYKLHKELDEDMKIGIITHKRFKDHFKEFKVLTYGNQRGQNKLKECDILIILGTYQMPSRGIIEQHNKLYLTNLEVNEGGKYDDYIDERDYHEYEVSKAMSEIEECIYWYPDMQLKPDDAKKHVPYKFVDMRRQACDYYKLYPDTEGILHRENIKLRLIESTMREDEMYQAINRARLFKIKKTVYVLGIIPERIENEFKCYDIKINDLIADLESKVHKLRRKTTDIESYFKDGERISYIMGDIMRDLGYSRSTAYKKINDVLEVSHEWTKKSVKEEGIDGLVDILIKKTEIGITSSSLECTA